MMHIEAEHCINFRASKRRRICIAMSRLYLLGSEVKELPV